jgi:hypothetical protein
MRCYQSSTKHYAYLLRAMVSAWLVLSLLSVALLF